MARRDGFTLIELLVVIAIIAILAAILFPVFLRAKQAANKATCSNNLKQMSQAFQLYADDNGNTVPLDYTRCPNGTYPDGNPTSASNSNFAYLWMHYIYRYVKNVNVYNCPSSPGAKFTGDYYWVPTDEPKYRDKELVAEYGSTHTTIYYNASYGYNRWLGRYLQPYDPQRVTWSQISRSTVTPLLADCGYYLMGPQYSTVSLGNDYRPAERHSGLTNMSFVDGHVKSVKRSDWVTDNAHSASDPVWRKWDPLL